MSTYRNRRLATLLLASASFVALTPANAAQILFSSAIPAGPVTAGQPVQTTSGTTQVQLDNGTIVSFVGPASFSVDSGGQMQVTSGATTIIAGGRPTTIGLPGGSAVVTGMGSFTISGGEINGRAAIGSAMALSSGGQTRQVTSGKSFGFALGSTPTATFTAPAQAVTNVAQADDSGGSTQTASAVPLPQQNPVIQAIPTGSPTVVAQYIAGNAGNPVFAQFAPVVSTIVNPTPPATNPPITNPPVVTPPVTQPPVVTQSSTGGSTGDSGSGGSGGTGSNGSSGGSDGGSGGGGSSGGNTGSTVATTATRGVAILGRNSASTPTTAGGDPGVIAIGFDANGMAIDFGRYGKTLTATLAESRSGTGWQIGRYASGDFQRGSTSPTTFTLGANDGVHYAIVAPLSGAVPSTGLATYTVAGFTAPTLANGAVVSNANFTANLGVAFGSVPLIGYDGSLSYTDGTGASNYTFTTSGGAAAPSIASKLIRLNANELQIYGQAPLSGSGSACASGSTCRLDLTGVFGGADATLFGAWYAVTDATLNKTTLNGAAVFTRSAYDSSNTIGNPPVTGGGAAGTGVDITTANSSGLTTGFYYAGYVGANGSFRTVVDAGFQDVSFDANGNVTKIGQLLKSGGKLLQVSSGTGWTIGRFGDGDITSGGATNPYGVQQGISFFTVAPTTALPTSGIAYYTATETIAPAFASGQFAPGGVFAARLGIAFGSTIVYGYDGTLRLPTNDSGGFETYSFVAGGGANAPTLTNGMLVNGNYIINGRASVSTGSLCAGASDCLLYLRGATGGANATLFGSTYELYNITAGGKQIVNGAALFTKTGGTGAAATGATGGAGGNPTPYIISYTANNIGIDTRSGVTATFVDGSLSSALNSYYASYQEALGKGTTTAVQAYGDGIISVGRWSGGSTTTGYYSSGAIPIPANGGFDYVIGSQSSNLPTSGSLTYSLLGATPVTLTDGSGAPGTVDSANMKVNFGTTTKIGLDLTITMPGDTTYSFATIGGIADPSQSQISVTQPNFYTGQTRFGLANDLSQPSLAAVAVGGSGSGSGSGSGVSCSSSATCKIFIQGFFAGDQVQRAGYAFTIGENGSTVGAKTLHGSVALGSSSGLTIPTLPPAPTPENTGTIGTAYVGGSNRIITYGKDGSTQLVARTSNLNLGFDANNKLGSIQVSGGGVNIERGAAVTGEAYGTANAQIGRWNGGAITGVTNTSTDAGFKGFHFALLNAPLSTALPSTGILTYTLAQATKPTYGNGAFQEGTFSGSLAIGFDTATTKHVGFDFSVAMPDRTYQVSTTGGAANPGLSNLFLTNTGQFQGVAVALAGNSGSACPNSSCSFSAQGGMAGPNGREFAFTYAIGGSGAGNSNFDVFGSAAFTSASAATTPVTFDTLSTNSSDAFANGNYAMLSTTGGVRTNWAMTFGPQHELLSGTANSDSVGSNRVYEAGSRSLTASGGTATAFMGWGRWADGRTPGSNVYSNGRSQHYVYGTPTTVFPTSGTATYTLVGATAPTANTGTNQPGTVTSANLAIAFGSTTRVGFDAALTMPGDASYTISTTGGASNPGSSGFTISNGTASFSGSAAVTAIPIGATSVVCGGGACPAAVINGMMFGAQAAGVGITYGMGSGNNVVQGALAFSRN